MQREKIDWKGTLVLHDSSGATTRKVFVKAILKNGCARVTTEPNTKDGFIFDEYGDYLGADEGVVHGSALYVRNLGAAKFTLELNAKEMALIRVLVGQTYSCFPTDALFEDIVDFLEDADLYLEATKSVSTGPINVLATSDSFKRIVEAYERAGQKVDGQPFVIPRKGE